MIEDFIYGDMNRWGGIWHNWSFFAPPYALIICGYALMHNVHGDEVHGGLRYPKLGMFDAIQATGQAPYTWPVTLYN